MERYQRTWAWMIVPLIIMQLGIFRDYWGDFADNTWAVHVHYWLVSFWYLLLISQPWLIAQNKISTHRTWGIIGMFIAGGVAFTSISQLNRDLVYTDYLIANPNGIGPFEPWFFLGIAVVEIILISGFIIAVLSAILQRKSPEDHGWWLISTAFILIMPALGRGLQGVAIAIYGFSPDIKIVVMPPVYITQAIIILMILGVAKYLGKLNHPATYLAVGVNFAALFLEQFGKNPALEAILRFVIKA